MTAFVDESILLAGSGCYVLGCVILPVEKKAQVRREVRKILPSGRTFHWSKERIEVREAMVHTLGVHAESLLGYFRRPVVRREHEGVRADLLAELVADLARLGVGELVIESRQSHNDVRDRRVVASIQPTIGLDLDYRHSGPREEPLLWLADALAGLISAQVRKDRRYLDLLPNGLLTEKGP